MNTDPDSKQYTQIGDYCFSYEDCLGRGSFGAVYKGFHETNKKELFAIKVMPIQNLIDNKKLRELAIREIETLQRLHGDHIVRLVDVSQNVHNLYLIFEYCNGGDLEKKLSTQKTLPEEEACSIVKQIADVFIHLNEQEGLNQNGRHMVIMHRDIKPANILFHDGQAKLSDFGFVKIIEDVDKEIAQSGTLLGTRQYCPPQILSDDKYSAKCDVWSTGVLLYKCLFGGYPWKGESDIHLFELINKIPVLFPKEIKQETKDLLRGMLKIDEKDRFSWNEVYAHPALKEIEIRRREN